MTTGRSVEVIAAGPLSAIQDRGRRGVQHLGFSPSGAADQYAVEVGNLLLGNSPSAAAIEMTMGDASFVFRGAALFAVTGTEADLQLDGRPLEPWRVYAGAEGAALRIGRARAGARVYLCVAGGIDTPVLYGSRSTDLVARIGGHEGRPLRAGDVLPVGPPAPEGRPGRRLAPLMRPPQGHIRIIRAVPGPQAGAFTDESERVLYGAIYRVSPRADRTGVYLEGPRLSHTRRPDILSEGVTAGSIQVPGDGRPLVLLAEHRSVGGYAKIATVCAPDLASLGQARPGDRILFARADHAEAQAAYRAFRRMCTHAGTTSSVAPVVSPLPLDEWLDAVDMASAGHRDIMDERLPLLRADLRALRRMASGEWQGQDRSMPALELRIQAIMPDGAFPAMHAHAPATGTLLALESAAVSAPAGTILGALWSPGALTVIVTMHPLAVCRPRCHLGQRVRKGELLLSGSFVEGVAILDGPAEA